MRAERDLLKLDIQSVVNSLSPVEIVTCVSTIQHEMCGWVGGICTPREDLIPAVLCFTKLICFSSAHKK